MYRRRRLVRRTVTSRLFLVPVRPKVPIDLSAHLCLLWRAKTPTESKLSGGGSSPPISFAIRKQAPSPLDLGTPSVSMNQALAEAGRGMLSLERCMKQWSREWSARQYSPNYVSIEQYYRSGNRP